MNQFAVSARELFARGYVSDKPDRGLRSDLADTSGEYLASKDRGIELCKNIPAHEYRTYLKRLKKFGLNDWFEDFLETKSEDDDYCSNLKKLWGKDESASECILGESLRELNNINQIDEGFVSCAESLWKLFEEHYWGLSRSDDLIVALCVWETTLLMFGTLDAESNRRNCQFLRQTWEEADAQYEEVSEFYRWVLTGYGDDSKNFQPLRDFEDLIKPLSEVGKRMRNLLENEVVWNKLEAVMTEEETEDLLYLTAILTHQSLKEDHKYDEYAYFFMRYYGRMPKNRIYLYRCIVNVADHITDISLSEAFMGFFILNLKVDEELATNGIKKSRLMAARCLNRWVNTIADKKYMPRNADIEWQKYELTWKQRITDKKDHAGFENFVWNEIIKDNRIRDNFSGIMTDDELLEMTERFRLKDLKRMLINVSYVNNRELLKPSNNNEWDDLLSSTLQTLVSVKRAENMENAIRQREIRQFIENRHKERIEDLICSDLKDSFNRLSEEREILFQEIVKEKEDLEARNAEYEEKLEEINNRFREEVENGLGFAGYLKQEVIDGLEKEQKAVMKQAGKEGDNLLDSRLSQELRDAIYQQIYTAELIFRFLKKTDDGNSQGGNPVDYAAAILPLTKAIEILLREAVYMKTDINDLKNGLDLQDQFNEIYFDKYKKIKLNKKIMFASLNRLFQDPDNNSSISKWEDWWNKNDKILDLGEISHFAGTEIPTKNGTVKFTNDKDTNRARLFDVLDDIRDRYRNHSAHQYGMKEADYEECKKILINEKWILWMLLLMIK